MKNENGFPLELKVTNALNERYINALCDYVKIKKLEIFILASIPVSVQILNLGSRFDYH